MQMVFACSLLCTIYFLSMYSDNDHRCCAARCLMILLRCFSLPAQCLERTSTLSPDCVSLDSHTEPSSLVLSIEQSDCLLHRNSEILMCVRRCMQQQHSIRSLIYKGFQSISDEKDVSSNILEQIFEVLASHFSSYCASSISLTESFINCISRGNISLQEPLGDLLLVTWRVALRIISDDSLCNSDLWKSSVDLCKFVKNN